MTSPPSPLLKGEGCRAQQEVAAYFKVIEINSYGKDNHERGAVPSP